MDEIEAEIERADLVKENIQLAIANIDKAFPPTQVGSNLVQQQASSSTPTDGNENSPSPTLPLSTEVNSTPSTSTNPQVKLAKLELKKFDGDPSKWLPFWDTFKASVHDNKNLSPIDKFGYLNSLLERSAAEAVAGLSLTASNYNEATAILKARFGNKQQIINRQMEILLNLDSVTSNHNIKGLSQLHDTVESNVRSLKSLGVPLESYGGLLSSILINKLPQDFRLVITREELLQIFTSQL